jgi:hypothetical protein
MNLGRRTTFQLAFVLMGLIIWAYGHRIDDPTVRLVGIAFFAVAFVLRFFRSSDTRPNRGELDGEEEDVNRGS